MQAKQADRDGDGEAAGETQSPEFGSRSGKDTAANTQTGEHAASSGSLYAAKGSSMGA